ncbi:MAG: PspC domain-containing protein [Lachnospiraceae bacterium]|nr:PspC domain-containing protein [Lachnospiraceae bacterium]
MENNYKKLEKSRTNRMLCGVCGGIGNYFTVDPTIIRILWVIGAIASCGTALLAYFIAAVIIPEETI